MIDESRVGLVLVSGLTVLMLVAAWSLLWVRGSIDLYRERLFSIRRRLFSLVVSDRIDPNSLPYVYTRAYLNTLLRHANDLSTVYLFAAMFLRRHDSGVALKSKAALTALRKEDPALAKELDDMMVKAAIATVYHLVRTSPLAWLTFCVLLGTGMYKLIREVFEKVALEESQDMKLKPAACA